MRCEGKVIKNANTPRSHVVDTAKAIVRRNLSHMIILARLAPCSNEEADTRLLLRVADAIQSRFTKIIVSTVDAGVLVLTVALAQKLQMLSQEGIELWVSLFSIVHVLLITNAALSFAFYAFTNERVKKNAVETLSSLP